MGKGKHRSNIGYLMTVDLIEDYQDRADEGGWKLQKWVEFCALLMLEGFTCHVREAKSTVSKYITVQKPGSDIKPFLVRFSNHKPNRQREEAADCDFFVGITHLAVTNTGMAIGAVHRHFQPSKPESIPATVPPPPPNFEEHWEFMI